MIEALREERKMTARVQAAVSFHEDDLDSDEKGESKAA
jgi:hypothetical protein